MELRHLCYYVVVAEELHFAVDRSPVAKRIRAGRSDGGRRQPPGPSGRHHAARIVGAPPVAAVAGNGVDSLHLARKERFDIVVMDVGLPGLDGFDVLFALTTRWSRPSRFRTAGAAAGAPAPQRWRTPDLG